MVAVSSAQFRITVWRPARLHRELARLGASQEPLREGDVVEEAYVWEMPLDAWGCLLNSNALHDEFRGRFAADRSPKDRNVAHLEEFVRSLEQALANPTGSSWAATEEADDFDIPLLCDAARALAIHLDWIVRTFRDVPNCSVTVR